MFELDKSFALQAPVETYFATNVTGASWTISTTTIANSQAYKIAIKNNSATDHSGKTVTIVGLDQDGKAQTESFALPAGSATVYSTYYYSKLTSATPSSSIGASTMNIGFTSQFCSKTYPIDYGSIGAVIFVTFTGTCTYDVQGTPDNIQTVTPPFKWQNVGSPFISATASQNSYLVQAPRALRFITESYSSTPTIYFSVKQSQNKY